jgi:pimeloyl-ACP methyl ester carboxylesterase
LHALRADPGSAVAALKPALAPALAPDAALSSISAGEADAHIAEHPGTRAMLTAMIKEAVRQGAAGLAADIVATNVAPWGFELRAVQTHVSLVYGADDPIVTPEHGRWYQSQLASGSLEVVPDAGHLVIVAAWKWIVDALAGVIVAR